MKQNLLFLGSILLCLFIFLTLFVGIGYFNLIDLNATKTIQNIIPRIGDFPFSILSLFGSAESVSIILLLIMLIYRKLNYFYVLIGFGIFHIIEYIGKAFVTHPGPGSEFFRYYFSFSLPSSSVKPGSSYPSGHLGRTMFLSVLLIFIFFVSKNISKKNKYFFIFCILIFDILMFISRIYLGEHWLTDCLGGSLLGSSIALLTLAF